MCLYPRLAVRLGLKENGKQAIKFISADRVDYSYAYLKDKYGDALISLPCGHCPQCSKAYQKQWSVRLMLESLYHDEMSFVTLTYDNAHYPNSIEAWKRDGQLFMKRLRKYFDGRLIRYFGCGELGSLTKRKHFHFILFGVSFDREKVVGCNELGQECFSSEVLRSIWKNGHVSHGDVTPESCAYVARYSMKKLLSIDEDEPAFLVMSRMPGIGSLFFEDKKDILYLSDRVYSSSFHGEKIPRFFDKLAEKDPIVCDLFLKAKERRIKKGQQQQLENMITSFSHSVEEMQTRAIQEYVRRAVLPKRGF